MPTASWGDAGACGRGLDAALALAAPALQCGQSPAFSKASQKKKKREKNLFLQGGSTHIIPVYPTVPVWAVQCTMLGKLTVAQGGCERPALCGQRGTQHGAEPALLVLLWEGARSSSYLCPTQTIPACFLRGSERSAHHSVVLCCFRGAHNSPRYLTLLAAPLCWLQSLSGAQHSVITA